MVHLTVWRMVKFVSFHLILDSFFVPLHLTPFIMVLS